MAPTSSSLTLQTLLAITLATGTRGFGLSKQTAPERQADRVSQSIGLYRRLAENPTPDAILVLLCHGAGAAEGVKDCIGVPSIEEMLTSRGDAAGNTDGAASESAKLRRKREETATASGSGSWFPNWQFGPNPGSQSWSSPFGFDSSFGSGSTSWGTSGSWGKADHYLCPSQVNQSGDYELSADSAEYPASDISNELALVPDLMNSLLTQVILETDPPTLFFEDFLSVSNATCPFEQLRLWRYRSRKANSVCWVVQGFQENVLYRKCLASSPSQCAQEKGDNWNWAPTTKKINSCITEYDRVSLWAYCPSFPAAARIIRDRIVYPRSCTPFSVPCKGGNTRW